MAGTINKPDRVIVLGITYTIEYVDKPSEVDIHKRESLWGQVDFWTRTIRVYDNNTTIEDVWGTILHEVLHAIANDFKIECLEKEENHDDLDLLSLALTDVLFRNDWIKYENGKTGRP